MKMVGANGLEPLTSVLLQPGNPCEVIDSPPIFYIFSSITHQ
jgi:hypothetical protein